MNMKRATVSFTKKDLERLEKLKDALELHSNAQTLSMAIKIADEIRKQKISGGDVLFSRGGEIEKLFIPGLESEIKPELQPKKAASK